MALNIDTQKLTTVSPKDTLTFLGKIRVLLFGKVKPDIFTRIIYYLNFCGFVLFITWAALSYMAVTLSDLIYKSKGISVKEIVVKRGQQLSFEKGESFLQFYTQFQFIDIFVWLAFFFSLVLLYRKKTMYALFYFGSIILHFLLLFFLLGIDYIVEDISKFDKIVFGVMLLPTLLYFFLLKKEQTEEINEN